jgi:threonine dehydrogenase-like Zn-dependent dehydrogenase
MLSGLIMVYVIFSVVTAWRAAGVAIHSKNAQQRKDAFRVLALVWGSGTVGSGVIAGVTRLQELGWLK